MEEHVAAGVQVLGRGVLDLVVADAAFAGDEDHAGGSDTAHEDGVVAGAADDVEMRVAELAGGVAHRVHAVVGEVFRHEVGGGGELVGQTMPLTDGFDDFFQLRDHCGEGVGFQRAQVDGHVDLPGDDVARARVDLHHTHGTATVRRVIDGDAIDGDGDLGRAKHGVLAQ